MAEKFPPPVNPEIPYRRVEPDYAGATSEAPVPGIPASNTKALAANIQANVITFNKAASEVYKDRDIYVINATRSKAGATHAVSVYIPLNIDNTEVPLEVPVTWIPVCVTEITLAANLLKSVNFQRAVTNGSVKIVEPTFAENLLATQAAQDERARLARLRNRSYDAIMDPSIKPKPVAEDTEGVRPELVAAVKNGLADAVISIVTRAQVEDTLTTKEAGYVRNHISDPDVLAHLQ